MGIESDQLVYEYLGRVGDLAQRQHLPSAARMRLVVEVRDEIERQRGKAGTDSPAVVRRIIGRLGEPGELVAAAAESAAREEPGPASAPLPPPRSATPARGAADGPEDVTDAPVPAPRRGVFGPRPAAGAAGAERREEGSRRGASPFRKSRRARGADVPEESHPAHEGGGADADTGRDTGTEPESGAGYWPDPSAPHVIGLDRLGETSGEPEWWRVEPGPFGEFGDGVRVPGFVGGVEIPALLKPPPRPRGDGDPEDDRDGTDDRERAARPGGLESTEDGAGGAADTPPPPARRRLPLPLRRRRAPAPAAAAPAPAPAGRRLGQPVLLAAAALLVGGAVVGSWLALVGGWLLAYSSRSLSRAEAKWAALGLPGVVAAGAVVWVWGRLRGRWGEPIAEGATGDTLTGLWPVVLRTAAVASAAYLVWRARRVRG